MASNQSDDEVDHSRAVTFSMSKEEADFCLNALKIAQGVAGLLSGVKVEQIAEKLVNRLEDAIEHRYPY